MRFLFFFVSFVSLAAALILENGQLRKNPYPGQASVVSQDGNRRWKAHSVNASELSYKGRWVSEYISWWSAPGLKFGYTGGNVAIRFAEYTSPGVLVGYRVDGLDWQFSNVTGNATYEFVNASNSTSSGNTTQTFELRVTNWAYGVQINKVYTAAQGRLVKIPNHPIKLEFIGDSLTASYSATYEGLSSFGWGVGAGLGNVEFSISAYSGICLHDAVCWGNPRGQTYQWLQTSDVSYHYVLINLGTNDNNTANPVKPDQYYNSYIKLIETVHKKWPKAQIVVSTLWNGFYQSGNYYYQVGAFIEEIPAVGKHFNNAGGDYVHLFNTTGILQHNDVEPEYHPTDAGHIKVASHLIQYLKIKFGLELAATGPEVFSHTTYWNTETGY